LNYFGVAVGRKALLPDINLPQLVVALTNSAGMTQTPHGLRGRLKQMLLDSEDANKRDQSSVQIKDTALE
jgi:hypothetical protein